MARDDFDLDEVLRESSFGFEADPYDGHETTFDDFENGNGYDLASEFGDEPNALSQQEVDTLAYELMGLSSEREAEEFLGKILGSVAKNLRRSVKKVLPHAVRMLKGPGAKLLAKALPLIGTAAGTVVPGVGNLVGGAAGGMLGQMIEGGAAGDAVGMVGSLMGEMGYGTQHEARHDIARRVIGTISDAAARAATDARAAINPQAVARAAMSGAVGKNLPGALRNVLAGSGASGNGRWVRQGDRIIVMGV